MSAMATDTGTLKGSILKWAKPADGIRESIAESLLDMARNGSLPEGSNELAWERIARSVRGMLHKKVIDFPSAQECHAVNGAVMEVIGTLGAPDLTQHFDDLRADYVDEIRDCVRTHALCNYMSGSAPIVNFGIDGSMKVYVFEQKGGI